jgi:acetyltransferase-like isoleucine patch superfamily enzyme
MLWAWIWPVGWLATWCATCFVPPYRGRTPLASWNSRGYVSPNATIYATDFQSGANVFIGDRVVIYQDKDGGPIELGNRVHLHGDSFLETGQGGSIHIGENTHIQPRCQFSGYLASITVGCGVNIASGCAFYPYDHGIGPDNSIGHQPLHSKGGIVIEDEAWLGYGVIVLSGVRIGKGAVVGAGAVVKHDVPDGAVAVGVPARVVRMRSDTPACRTSLSV